MVYIKKIEITEFGKFSGYSLEFENGFNEFILPNEFGKSTIVDFIVFMLYGFKKTTSKKLGISENLLEKYMPWSDSGKISGMLTLERDGVTYTIERKQLRSGRMTVTLRDETGAEQMFDKTPGEEFFAVDEQTFLKTFLVRQTDMVFERTDGIVTALNNLVTTGDDGTSFDDALKELKAKKNKYQQGDIRKGRIFDIPKEITELEQKKFILKRDAGELRSQLTESESVKERLRNITGLEKSKRAILEDARYSDAVRIYNQIQSINAQISSINTGEAAKKTALEPALAALISEDFSKKRMLLQKIDESDSEICRLEEIITAKKQGCANFDLIKENEQQAQKIANTPAKINGVFLTAGLILLVIGAVLGFIFTPALAVCLGGAILTVLAFVIKTQPKVPSHIGLTIEELRSALVQYGSVKSEVELYSVMLEKERASKLSAVNQLTQTESRLEKYNAEYGIDSPETLIVMQSQAADAKAIAERTGLLERSKAQLLAGRDESEFDVYANGQLRTDKTAKEAEAELSQLLLEKSNLLSRSAAFERLEAQYTDYMQALKDCETAIKALNTELDEVTYNNEVLALAIDALKEAHDEINRVYSPIITEKASLPLSEFTDGKYESVYLDKDFQIRVKTEGALHELGYFSKGTADAVYFAVRHAVNDIISERTGLPVIMDDPFWSLDGNRLENARGFMKKLANQKQVIIFGAR